MTIDPERIKAFHERGYFLVDQLFAPDEIAAVSRAFDRLQQMAAQFERPTLHNGTRFVVEGGTIHRIVWCPGVEPQLRNFARDQRLVQPAARLLDSPSIQQIICQAHYKLPRDGVNFPFHQDSQNRGYGTDDWQDVNGRGSYVQTLTAIDPMTTDNAPLLVFPYSGTKGHLNLDQRPLTKVLPNQTPDTITMSPGSTLFFNPYLVHGSLANTSRHPRRVFINGYAYPGANRREYPGSGLGETIAVD